MCYYRVAISRRSRCACLVQALRRRGAGAICGHFLALFWRCSGASLALFPLIFRFSDESGCSGAAGADLSMLLGGSRAPYLTPSCSRPEGVSRGAITVFLLRWLYSSHRCRKSCGWALSEAASRHTRTPPSPPQFGSYGARGGQGGEQRRAEKPQKPHPYTPHSRSETGR